MVYSISKKYIIRVHLPPPQGFIGEKRWYSVLTVIDLLRPSIWLAQCHSVTGRITI